MTAPSSPFIRGAPVSIVDVATDRARYVTRVEAVGKTCVRVAVAEHGEHAATWGIDGACGSVKGVRKGFVADPLALLRLRPWRDGDDDSAEVWALAGLLEDVSRERWDRAGAAHGLAVLRDVARWVGVAVQVQAAPQVEAPRQIKIPGA